MLRIFLLRYPSFVLSAGSLISLLYKGSHKRSEVLESSTATLFTPGYHLLPFWTFIKPN